MSRPNRWLRGYGRHAEPAARLICFPYAGAGASIYRSWRLPAELAIEVWAVQPPGRENRLTEPPYRWLDDLLATLVEQLRPLQDRPVALFGHSMGALVFFELTRWLRRTGGPQPFHLFLSGHRAPDRAPNRGPVSCLSDDEFLERLLDMAGDSPSAVRDRELLLAMAPTTRADFQLCERYDYRPETPLATPITCFGAVDDSEIKVQDIAAWRHHTTGAFHLSTFTGGHLFLRDQPDALLGEIADRIAQGVAR